MAKQSGGDRWVALGVLGVLGFVALSYLQSGRGKDNNSPLVPDKLEDQIDAVVSALNRYFGEQWVNTGLDALQAYIAKALPGLDAVVRAVHWAEHSYYQQVGPIKKQKAIYKYKMTVAGRR